MKKRILFLIIVGVLSSCNKNNDANAEVFGNWKLIEMMGSIPNSIATGSDMGWQETYMLKNDGSFKKSRNKNGVITEVSGTYKVINLSNEMSLELIFNNESDMIGSCYSGLKEEMYFESKNILTSTWRNCDGPGLKYEKVN